MGSRILVVEHDEAMAGALEAALRREGLEAISAVDGASALQSFHEARPDAVLLAVELGDESGVEVCQALRDAPRGQLVPILFMGSGDERSLIRSPGDALSHGGDYFFPLPNDLDYLAGRVRGWTSDGDPERTVISRDDTEANAPAREPEPPSVAIPDFDALNPETITEHDFSPVPPILRVKSKSGREDDITVTMVEQAEALRKAGEIMEAIELYAAAAAMYETDDAFGPAIAIYKLILGIDPGEYETARHAGQLAARVGRTKDALEIYQRTADALEARGALDNATFLIHEMIRLRPEDAALRRRLEELQIALESDREKENANTFDDLIGQEIGRSLQANTLDLVPLPAEPLPEEEDLLSQDTLQGQPQVIELDRPKRVHLVTDLEVPSVKLPIAAKPLDTEDAIEDDEDSERTPADHIPFPEQTDQLPVPEPADEATVHPQAFETLPLTMGGWSRLPVWNDVGDASRSSAQLLSKVPPPVYGETSYLAPARFVPEEGTLSSLVEVVRLLARIEEQRATGLLEVPGAPRIVFVEGQPAALRGYRAVQAFLTLLLNSGKVDERAVKDLMAHSQSERPVEVARLFVRHGFLREHEGTVYLHRHFEDGLTALLRQHGAFEFDGSTEVQVVREEIVPEIDDVRRLLIDLLPRVAGREELLSAIGGPGARIRVGALAEEGPSRDARFLAILDGRYEIAEAARLAAMPPERAAALAFVYVQFGLATIVQPRKGRSSLGWIPLGQPTASEPVLSAPPKRIKPVQIVRSIDVHADAASRLRALADLVNANDYFTILGVSPTADTSEVQQAHARLIDLIDTDALGMDLELVELARRVRRSLDEARDVLASPALRAAYQQHLEE